MRCGCFVDYLRVRIRPSDFSFWDRFGVAEWVDSGVRGVIGHDSIRRGPFGASWARSHADGSVLLTLPGRWLAAFDWADWCELLMGSVVRLDLACNVAGDIEDWIEPAVSGCLSSARKFKVIRSDSGSTVYWGGRQSELMVRAYDRRFDPGDTDTALNLRAEVELKGEMAASVATALVFGESLDSLFCSAMMSRAPRERAGAHRSRERVRAWFSALFTATRELPARVAKVTLTVAQKARWVENQVSAVLARCVGVYGLEWLRGVYLEGQRRNLVRDHWASDQFEQKVMGRKIFQQSLGFG